jgi:hypothetical protein
MSDDAVELDEMQSQYKEAVEEWIAAIRQEEMLASGDHSEAEIDEWESAGFAEEKARDQAKKAKTEYEEALRKKFFNF